MQEKHVVKASQSIRDVMSEFSSNVCMIQLHVCYMHYFAQAESLPLKSILTLAGQGKYGACERKIGMLFIS